MREDNQNSFEGFSVERTEVRPVTGDKPVGTDGDGCPEDRLVLGRQSDVRAGNNAVFPGDQTGNLFEAGQPLRTLLFKVSFGLFPNAGMSRQRGILRKGKDKLLRWTPGLGGCSGSVVGLEIPFGATQDLRMSSIWESEATIAHTECLVRSLKHWTGEDLVTGVNDPRELSRMVFESSFVLVSHGTEEDPILNYGNQSALELWDVSWDEFTKMPSRLTAEAPNREARARLLERVTRDGFISDYSGIRIGRSGRRFRIENATVWNLLSADGRACGQAAMFRHWTFIS